MLKSDCLFCKIIQKKIPADIVYEDDNILGFNDINPQAPVHVLFIPKNRHIEKISDTKKEDHEIIGQLVSAANKIAKKNNIVDDGFRLVFNCNKNAGQAVFHIHLHLLGGRIFSWPPG